MIKGAMPCSVVHSRCMHFHLLGSEGRKCKQNECLFLCVNFSEISRLVLMLPIIMVIWKNLEVFKILILIIIFFSKN